MANVIPHSLALSSSEPAALTWGEVSSKHHPREEASLTAFVF